MSNRAEGPHEVFDLDITTFSGKDLCNVARSEIDLPKKGGVITSPASSHHRPYEGKSSSVVAPSGVISG